MTDDIETVEGFEVGQVITVGGEYWISAENDVTPEPCRTGPLIGGGFPTNLFGGNSVEAGKQAEIVNFVQGRTFTGAVLRLQRSEESGPAPHSAPSGTLFLVPLGLLRCWAAREALAKKYAKEDKR